MGRKALDVADPPSLHIAPAPATQPAAFKGDQGSPLNNGSGSSNGSSSSMRKRTTNEENDETDKSDGDDGVALDPKFEGELKELKSKLRIQRQKLTFFRSPLRVTFEFLKALIHYAQQLITYLFSHLVLLYGLLAFSITLIGIIYIPGQHQLYVNQVETFLSFAAWWILLGILSSVGLGTGLHTFVLYLGPHIIKVTLAAAECNSLNFHTEGVRAFICPGTSDPTAVTFLGILLKVQMAAFLWGAGTAIGELPPYFVSRAATLSGQKLAELDDLKEAKTEGDITLMDKVKKWIYSSLQRYGFWFIVACASIPNPLFDLAGITCGHFLIPFWTFFGATVIGKAVFKVHIQTCFVILAFHPAHLEGFIDLIERAIPWAQGKLQPLFAAQRAAFHVGPTSVAERSILAKCWDIVLMLMIGYFLKSIIEGTVQERVAIRDQATIAKFKLDHRLRTAAAQNGEQN
jgi:membrane protein YqaA with SNARE-associated domain